MDECVLQNGDIIQVGISRLLFESEPVHASKPVEASPEGIAVKPRMRLPAQNNSHEPGALLDSVLAAGNMGHAAVKKEGTLIALTDSDFDATIFEQCLPWESANTQQLVDSQKRLAVIYKANQIISSEQDINKLFKLVMEQIFAMVPAHNGFIILKDEATGKSVNVFIKAASDDTGSVIGSKVVSSTIVSRSLEKREALLSINAAKDERFDGSKSITMQDIASVMCVPLIHQHEVLGVVYVDTRGSASAFVQDDLELLVALAGPSAIAIRNAQYLRKLERAYHDTIAALSNSVEARDHYTVGHSWRVTSIAMQMARAMGWTEEQLKVCEMGGVLHDVGKIGIDDIILRKPGVLTDREFAKIKVHAEKGAQMLQDIPFLKPVIPYCLYHHERFDGKGYPFGLSGDKIPLEGRIIAVADTFDAMTTNRSYRGGMAPETAIAELENGKGTQFDPACVDVFLQCYRKGVFLSIMKHHEPSDNSVPCPFCSTHISVPEDVGMNAVFRCDVCKREAQVEE